MHIFIYALYHINDLTPKQNRNDTSMQWSTEWKGEERDWVWGDSGKDKILTRFKMAIDLVFKLLNFLVIREASKETGIAEKENVGEAAVVFNYFDSKRSGT